MLEARHLTRFLILLAALTAGAAVAQQEQEVVTPEEFLADEISPDALTVNEDDTLGLANLTVDDLVQCLGYVGDLQGENLIVYGFGMLDRREYQLDGQQAVVRTLSRARLNAQTQAARFFAGVRQTSVTLNVDASTQTQTGTVSESEVGEVVQRSLSSETRNQLVSVEADATTAYLQGGRIVGTKLISLDNGDMCVGVRYELPLDQDGFDPADRARDEAAPRDSGEDGTEARNRVGEEPVPPGEGTRGKF